MKLPSHLMARAATLCALTLTAGCTHLLTPLGDDKYDCNRKEDPTSPYCHSFRSVESATKGPIPDSRYDETMRLADHDRLTGIAPVGAASPASAPRSDGQQPVRQSTPSLVAAPSTAGDTPVRTGPLVQRVWVKRHVDGRDMLVANTVIYKEIVPSQWAGFEAVGSANTTAGGRPVATAYPHRASPASSSPRMPAKSGLNSARAANASEPTEFVQPGAKAPEPADVAPVPASESGTPSMPQ